MTRAKKPARGGARPGAGRPRTTGRGRGSGRPITLRVSDDENAALTAAAGGDPKAVGRYLRGAGLALPLVVDALDSAGDTLTGEEACGIALGVLRRVVPRRGPPPDHRDAEIARLRALRDRYFAAAVATADAIDGGSLGPVHSGGESDAEFQAECVRFAEGLPARAAKVRAELASIDGALRDCYALARAKLARESRPGGWADIVRFCERAGIKASPLRSAEARDAAKADVPTPPPEIEAAITAAAWSIAELDRRADVMAQPEIGAIRTAITSALAAAREAGRREVLEGAAGVETSLLKLAAVAYSQGTHAVRARIGEDGADRDHLRASGDLIVAEQSHRAAIAADKAALDATWRAHDLERDAEVAQAQAATHEACAALQAICDALHVTPPTGSTYCTEAVAMVVERVAADKARAVEAATAELRADLATAHEAIGQAQVEIVRLSSPVPQFRDAPPSPEFTEDLREAAAAARLAAHGIDAGAELVKFTAEHYNRLADAEGPFTTTDATSMREWMAQWPLSADVLPTARITLVRLLRAVEGMRQVLSQADAERLVDAFDESTFDRSNPARAALLAALTGEVAP